MILTEPYINFLIENDITPTQFIVLTLLYEKEIKQIKRYKEAFTDGKGILPKDQIENLVMRDFLVKTPKGYKLGKEFTKIFVTSEKAVDEVYKAYPPFMTSDKGVPIPLTAMDREVFKQIYIPKIMGSLDEHKEVIEDLKYAVDNDLIKVGINKFVTSGQWLSFRQLRRSQTSTGRTENLNSF
jgi:hypothetical protein